MYWFKKTDNPLVEVQEIRQRRTKVEIPRERVRELLEAEARRIYKGSGEIDYFIVKECGPLSTNPIKDHVAEFIFFDKV